MFMIKLYDININIVNYYHLGIKAVQSNDFVKKVSFLRSSQIIVM